MDDVNQITVHHNVMHKFLYYGYQFCDGYMEDENEEIFTCRVTFNEKIIKYKN